jgi:DNA-binding NtrC family response regulator
MMLRLIAGDRWYDLRDEPRTIGRSDENDIVLNHAGVSRRHAVLTKRGSDYVLRDAGSKNGLIVGGRRLDEVVLEPGVVVRIGDATIRLDDSPIGSADTETLLSGGGGPAGAVRFLTQLDQRPRRPTQEIIMEARRLFRAAFMAVAEQRSDEIMILAAAGPMEPGRELVARALRAKPEQEDERLDGVSLLCAGRRSHGIARALMLGWSGPPRFVQPWERDLFDALAARFLKQKPEETKEDEAEVPLPRGFVAESRAMHNLIEELRPWIDRRAHILLEGETGTGKEVMARFIHGLSSRRKRPLVMVNSFELPEHLAESELFGIESEVATGVRARTGLIAEADGGTLFIDEIEDLSEAMQGRFLRLLQEGEIRPVGARKPQTVDVRVIAATNRVGLPNAGLRQDLFQRFAERVRVPPLRERREDIEALAILFANETAAGEGFGEISLTLPALDLLRHASWPGNVRELRNVVSRAVLRHGRRGFLHEGDFPDLPSSPAPVREAPAPLGSLKSVLDAAARQAIGRALQENGGNVSAAARRLDISRNALMKRMARLGISSRR